MKILQRRMRRTPPWGASLRVLAFVAWVAFSGSLPASDEYSWPGNIVTGLEPGRADLPLPKSLDPAFPESFDWLTYIVKDGHSTIDQRQRALQASEILWKRLIVVEDRERKERLKFGGKEGAKTFDQMQQQWRLLCALECEDYSGPASEDRGSGWKARFPLFVAKQILQRIKYLNIEG